jgi:hypothetical protein
VRTSFAVIYCLVAAAGCAAFKKQAESEPSSLPALKPAGDTVGLEIAFLKLAPTAQSQANLVWNDVDETRLPNELRRRLHANGMRCGCFGAQMPETLRQLVDQATESQVGSTEDGVQVGAGHVHTRRQLQSRTAQRNEILASQILPEIAVLSNVGGQIVGNTYHDAQCIWNLKTFPQGDGRVRLQLTPEVHYGKPQNQWIGQSTGIFRQVTARRRKVFEDLRSEIDVNPGHTCLLSATDPVKGLGHHFFTYGAEAETPGPKLLLIRLARTQYEDLFGGEQILAPIVSVPE